LLVLYGERHSKGRTELRDKANLDKLIIFETILGSLITNSLRVPIASQY